MLTLGRSGTAASGSRCSAARREALRRRSATAHIKQENPRWRYLRVFYKISHFEDFQSATSPCVELDFSFVTATMRSILPGHFRLLIRWPQPLAILHMIFMSSRSPEGRFPAMRACRSRQSRSAGARLTPSYSWVAISNRCRHRRTSPLPGNWSPEPHGWQACVQGRFCLRKPACWTA
jgi:hypothetical protein